MGKILLFLLFMIYYWYFYFSYSKPLRKPTEKAPLATPYHPQFQESSSSHQFQFTLNGKKVWEGDIPDSYTYHNQKLIQQDVCHSFPNGHKVAAEGYYLYDFLESHPIFKDLQPFKEDASSIMQTGTVFYFTCLNKQIYDLKKCPSGEIFVTDHCESIQSCTHQPDGTFLANPENPFDYILCMHGQPVPEQCPSDTFFHFNKCFPKKDLTTYCHFFKAPFLLDSLRVSCDKTKLLLHKCPEGYKFFSIDRCELAVCDGHPDGHREPMKPVTKGPFQYVPGYLECRDHQVRRRVQCPSLWNSQGSREDNLTHLPMVFDTHQQTCVIPSFQTGSVTSSESDVWVPLYQFAKEIGNWEHAALYDSLAGYTKVNHHIEYRELPPGQRIDSNYKQVSACTSPTAQIPILHHPNQYYDCATQTIQTCGAEEQFAGNACHPKSTTTAHAFQFHGLDIFKFSPLSLDNWMVPWDYKQGTQAICHAPNDVHIPHYNLCSHPECTKFPFLSQIAMPHILLNGHSRCVYQSDERTLVKETFEETNTCDFWSQQLIPKDSPPMVTECQPSQRIQTGNFMWDRTLYATCQENEPFVFCPSSETDGIIEVKSGKFACKIPDMKRTFHFSSTTPVHFHKNEIKTIYRTHPNQSIELKHRTSIILREDKTDVSRLHQALDLRAVDGPVHLEFHYRVTYPSDVGFQNVHEEWVSKHAPSTGGAFLIKTTNFTQHPVNYPNYDIQSFVGELKI